MRVALDTTNILPAVKDTYHLLADGIVAVAALRQWRSPPSRMGQGLRGTWVPA